jgi:hypothetical protein
MAGGTGTTSRVVRFGMDGRNLAVKPILWIIGLKA